MWGHEYIKVQGPLLSIILVPFGFVKNCFPGFPISISMAVGASKTLNRRHPGRSQWRTFIMCSCPAEIPDGQMFDIFLMVQVSRIKFMPVYGCSH